MAGKWNSHKAFTNKGKPNPKEQRTSTITVSLSYFILNNETSIFIHKNLQKFIFKKYRN